MQGESLDQRILYEDNHLLVINKKAGWLSQGDKTGDEDVLEKGKAFIKIRDQKPGNVFLGLVHRLDRPVSGVLLLAKTSKALSRLTTAFRKRQPQKTYWAISRHQPPGTSGILEHHLSKNRMKNVVMAHEHPAPNAKPAQLTYRVLAEVAGYTLLEVHPHTGRPHQIRVQLAAIGCPIVGDIKYGDPTPLPDKSIGLHALRLQIQHPVGQAPLRFQAPLPHLDIWHHFSPFTIDN